jgi:serine/threonine-protein kinase RsbW
MFPSRREAWKDARALVDAFCAGAGVTRQVCLRARLVLEELFLNTVTHGHAGGSDAPIWITLGADAGRVSFVYEDMAPPYNPFATPTRERLEKLARGGEGGLGVILAQKFAASAEYAYLFGRNRIRATLG